MEVSGEQEYIRHDPRGGAGVADGVEAKRGYQQQGKGAPGNHLEHACHNGKAGIAQPLNGEPQQVDKQKRNVECGADPQILLAEGQNFRHGGKVIGIQKQGSQRAAAAVQHGEHQNAVGNAQNGGVPHAGAHPLRLSGAYVLSGKGGDSGAHGIKGTHDEVADLAAGGHGRHIGRAEGIDGGLEHDAADGGDGVLQAHGQTHGQQVPDVFSLRYQVRPGQVQNGEVLRHVHKAQHAGNQLAEQSRPTGARYAHVELHNEENIQYHVQQTGENQKIQRRPGVAQGAEDAGQKVIEHGGGNAQKDQENIIVGVSKGVLRILHPDEDPPAVDGGEQGDAQRQHGGQQNHVTHVLPHAVKVTGAELLGNGNGKSGADTVAQAQHKKADGAGGTDACQRVHAQRLAHDHRVDHIIKLLEQQTQQQGKHKGKQQTHWGTAGHTSGFGVRHITASFI